MMKIVKPGTDDLYKGTCWECGAEMEARGRDLEHVPTLPSFARCPACEAIVDYRRVVPRKRTIAVSFCQGLGAAAVELVRGLADLLQLRNVSTKAAYEWGLLVGRVVAVLALVAWVLFLFAWMAT